MGDDRATWRKNIPEDFDGRFGEEWDGEVLWAPIWQTTVGLVITCAIGFGIVQGMVWMNDRHVEDNKPALSPLAEANEQNPPAGPLLQAHPEKEYRAMKADIDAHLNGYGWVDEVAGTVHIPIDQAMEMLLASAPAVPVAEDSEAEGAADAGTTDPAADASTDGGDHGEGSDHG